MAMTASSNVSPRGRAEGVFIAPNHTAFQSPLPYIRGFAGQGGVVFYARRPETYRIRSVPMATIRKEITTTASPDAVWKVIREVDALHTKLVPGFVTDTKLSEKVRTVTFGYGCPRTDSFD